MGFAYVVGAWLLLQFAEVLSELLNLPETVGPMVVSVVAIGFPITVFFAWAFEMTPEGVKREFEVDRSQSIAPQTGKKLNGAIVVLLALAVVYLLYDKFSVAGTAGHSGDAELAVVAPSGQPVENMGPVIDPKSIPISLQPRTENEIQILHL